MGRNFVIFDFYLSLPYQSFDMENISEIKEFNKLFSNYQGIFIRFANTYIQDEDTAEDIVVDSLVYYWENRHTLSKKANALPQLNKNFWKTILFFIIHDNILRT